MSEVPLQGAGYPNPKHESRADTVEAVEAALRRTESIRRNQVPCVLHRKPYTLKQCASVSLNPKPYTRGGQTAQLAFEGFVTCCLSLALSLPLRRGGGGRGRGCQVADRVTARME